MTDQDKKVTMAVLMCIHEPTKVNAKLAINLVKQVAKIYQIFLRGKSNGSENLAVCLMDFVDFRKPANEVLQPLYRCLSGITAPVRLTVDYLKIEFEKDVIDGIVFFVKSNNQNTIQVHSETFDVYICQNNIIDSSVQLQRIAYIHQLQNMCLSFNIEYNIIS